MARSLYICYFGVDQPLVHTQVIPYLRELTKDGHEITLLTFESAESIRELDSGKEAEIRSELQRSGITWKWLKYHKRFSVLATAYDVLRGVLFVRREIASRNSPDILHARVHVPGMMAALARKLSSNKPKILFDIRGFMPEEYTDAGLWPHGGLLYRIAKRAEAWLMRESDGFVVLTEKARSILFPESSETGADKDGRPVEVIPCCVDFSRRFTSCDGGVRAEVRARLGLDGRFVVTHVGALTGLYLTEEIADFLATAKQVEPSTFALFLTQTPPDEIISLLKERGFDDGDLFVAQVGPQEVRDYLEASDVALSFVKAGYATASRSPTKIPEYLAAGLPIIANTGVGDVDSVLNENGVGVSIDSFDVSSYKAALAKARCLEDIERRSRVTAQREFDLESVGGERYKNLYRRMLARPVETLAGKGTLYICYFWVKEPLVQTQVIPYLRELTKSGVKATLLTFEPAHSPLSKEEVLEERRRLEEIGIEWQFLTYHKSPSVPATLYDVVAGALRVRRIIDRRRIDIIHCRVHVPALMGAIGRLLSGHRPKLIFDIRGFFPEEYTDAGVWKENGYLYKSAKLVERWLFRQSDGFVVLTEKAREILFPESLSTGVDAIKRPVEVIPCCADISRFDGIDEQAARLRSQLGTTNRRVIVYVGALGGWYLTDDMLRLFAEARQVDPSVFVMILTKRDHDSLREQLSESGFADADMHVAAVPPRELPAYLKAADVGISLIKECYSKQSSSPTKIAEYLAAGLTVIANKGVGDVDATLSKEGIGVLLDDLSSKSMRAGIIRAFELTGDREKRIELAASDFDLEEVGGTRYRRLYTRTLGLQG